MNIGLFARLSERFPSLRQELEQVHALVCEAAYRPVPLDGRRAGAIRERLRDTGKRIDALARLRPRISVVTVCCSPKSGQEGR